MPKNNKKTKAKKTTKLLRHVCLGIFIGIVILIVLSILPIPGIYKLYTVRSGSMEPAIKTGSMAIVKPMTEYKTGDIITFNIYGDEDSVTTHRIFSINGNTIKTKGDANETVDVAQIKKENIIGKVIISIPFIGYPIGYAKTLPGLIILIIIPATIIVWEEIKKLKSEWNKTKKEEAKKNILFKKQSKIKNIPRKDKTEYPFTKIITIFVSIVCLATISNQAYYNDQEFSKSSISSANWKTSCLVINEVYYDVDSAHGLDGEDMNGQKGNGNQNNNPDEWVEIYNNCDYEVSMKNWTLTDNQAILTIHANKSVPAHGYGLLSKSANTWTQYWDFPNGLGNLDGIQIIETGEDGPPIYQIYDNTGDKIILKNKLGETIDQMNYGNNNHIWDPAVPGAPEGYSLSRTPVGFDTDQPSDFISNCIPSPGQPNTTICPSE